MKFNSFGEATKADVSKLAGLVLTDVRVRTFCVELVLSEQMTIIVRVNRSFQFRLGPQRETLCFDPTRKVHDVVAESSDFIFLQSMRCTAVRMTEEVFAISFVGDAELWIDFEETEFEPLEFVGLTGERHHELAFHHVL
jgi:hypothetical protein